MTDKARLEASSRGGRTAAKRLTPEQRTERSRRAALALHAQLPKGTMREWGRRGAVARNANLTPEQRSAHARRMAEAGRGKSTLEQRQKWGRMGAQARNANLSPERRKEISRMGAKAAQPVQRQRRAERRLRWRAAWLVATPWPHPPGTPCTSRCGGEAFARGLCMGCFLATWAPPRSVLGGVA